MNVDFYLPEFGATKIVTWKCHVGESTNGRTNMIIGRDLLTNLGLDQKFPDNIIIDRERPFKGCSASMVDVKNYKFKSITDTPVKLEESFINLYVNEEFKSDKVIK